MQAIWNDEHVIRQGQEGKTETQIREFWEGTLYKQIHSVEEATWKIGVENKPKLRTYRTFKTQLKLEPYLLSEKDKKGRYLLTSLRTGTNSYELIKGGTGDQEPKGTGFA